MSYSSFVVVKIKNLTIEKDKKVWYNCIDYNAYANKQGERYDF